MQSLRTGPARPWLLGLGLAVAASNGAPAAEASVHIVEPRADDILYGPTRIRVELDRRAAVERVDFFLDAYPEPVCSTAAPPYVCLFDAGKSFQGRKIRVRATGPSGRTIGRAAVETRGFPRPERVTRRTLTVPVVASARGDESPELVLEELTCYFAMRECRPVALVKLAESERFPVSLEVLIDVSGSVDVHRTELLEALSYVIDSAPVGVEIATTEFAATYSRLVPFTSDKEALRRGLLRLGSGGPRTCLVSAMRRSLFALEALPGHRMLFVISDGEENCLKNAREGLAYMDTMYDIVSISRAIAAPIYVYRYDPLERLDQTRSLFAKTYEGVAVETGGRLFSQGIIQGLPSALRDLVEDLESTWLVDLDLPPVARPDWKRRLVLELPPDRETRLRYPEYWEAENREDRMRAMLADGDPQARRWAASALRSYRKPEVLGELIRAVRAETIEESRAAELAAVGEMTAGMLLHGDSGDQKAAVKAIEALCEIDPALLAPLRPMLRVFPKLDPRPKLLDRLERCDGGDGHRGE